jgi:hypothetical protein
MAQQDNFAQQKHLRSPFSGLRKIKKMETLLCGIVPEAKSERR